MSTILENQHLETFSSARFTQVKRINNKGEVSNFYNDCKNRLFNIQQWNYMSLFNFAYQISTHNSLGVAVEKELEKGDYLKVAAHGGANKPVWFAVDEVQHIKEEDLSEEAMCIKLRQVDSPELNEFSPVGTLKNQCELHLKRLINTISMDIKIANQITIDQSRSFLNYLKWEVFAKQILLLL
ncbi:hypothetical protein [Pedobacter arcticus]|uniref:hypothetical protein n=1 Tax=Pedobacter arcticus TaxID=752140 RepID=UPI0002F818AE|nr:hypothetical protein [Pedobacter arcticus]